MFAQKTKLVNLIPATYKGEVVSSEAIGNLLGYSKRWLYYRLARESKWLNELKALGFSGELLEIPISRKSRGASLMKTLNHKDFQALLSYEACLGNADAARVLTGNEVKFDGKRLKESDEKRIQIKLAGELGGEIEVSTPFGKIDVLTSVEIIEVKSWRNWKCALGQILAYGYFYPCQQKRIHCYGNFPVNLSDIKNFLDERGIKLTWEV